MGFKDKRASAGFIFLASFGLAAGASLAQDLTVSITSSKVEPDENFYKIGGGRLTRSCDLNGSGPINMAGQIIKADLNLSNKDFWHLPSVELENLRGKSAEERRAYYDGMSKEEMDHMKANAQAELERLAPAWQAEFDQAFLAAADPTDVQKLHESLKKGLTAFVERVEKEQGLSMSVDIMISDSCGKQPEPKP